MARIVIAAEHSKILIVHNNLRITSILAGYDEQYNEWASNCIQQYIASCPTPYNIVYAFGNNKQVYVIVTLCLSS